MHSLPIFVRLAGRPVILVGEGEAADAKRRLLERAGAVVIGEDGDAALAIVVDDDAAVAGLKARGVLVNAVDRAELCDFTLPAIVDRDPVIVAIGTGGASAGLAAALRQRLEGVLPAGLGELAEALHAARDALRERYPDATKRRRAIGELLSEGGDLDPLSYPGEGAPQKVILSGDPEGRGPVVGPAILGPGLRRGSEKEVFVSFRLSSPDPDDLTLRQARSLANADRITHRANVPAAILNRARADAVRIETAAAPVDAAPGLTVDVEML